MQRAHRAKPCTRDTRYVDFSRDLHRVAVEAVGIELDTQLGKNGRVRPALAARRLVPGIVWQQHAHATLMEVVYRSGEVAETDQVELVALIQPEVRIGWPEQHLDRNSIGYAAGMTGSATGKQTLRVSQPHTLLTESMPP